MIYMFSQGQSKEEAMAPSADVSGPYTPWTLEDDARTHILD